jgi:AraC-like DNA-binding protein
MFQKTGVALMKDDRVEKILKFISNNIETLIDTKTLMEIAHLSESRMLHLFKEKMGLPIRNYILWFRLKTVLLQILNGESLTEAAYSAGFSDQAHMTRTCVKMIGIPPSQIIKNSKFVQVSFQE